MLSRFDRIPERDRQTDGQNWYINVARQRRDRNLVWVHVLSQTFIFLFV